MIIGIIVIISKLMKIAILLSTYNGEKYLVQQLNSIVNQTLLNEIHLYIRDDGSSDSTLEIIEEYRELINITLYKGENIGAAKSFWQLFMNDSIQADYYAFADQDDLWDDDKIERALTQIREYDDKPVLYCSNCRIINADNIVVDNEMNKSIPEFSIISQMICGTTQGCAMMFNDKLRKYIMHKNVKNVPMHDFVIMTYAIAYGEVIYDNKTTFGYRIHENNVVAKAGKSFFNYIKSGLNKWFSKQHRYELSYFARSFYDDNDELLDQKTKQYLRELSDSRNHVLSRIKIIMDRNTVSTNKRAERSFKIRVILGIV